MIEIRCYHNIDSSFLPIKHWRQIHLHSLLIRLIFNVRAKFRGSPLNCIVQITDMIACSRHISIFHQWSIKIISGRLSRRLDLYSVWVTPYEWGCLFIQKYVFLFRVSSSLQIIMSSFYLTISMFKNAFTTWNTIIWRLQFLSYLTEETNRGNSCCCQ